MFTAFKQLLFECTSVCVYLSVSPSFLPLLSFDTSSIYWLSYNINPVQIWLSTTCNQSKDSRIPSPGFFHNQPTQFLHEFLFLRDFLQIQPLFPPHGSDKDPEKYITVPYLISQNDMGIFFWCFALKHHKLRNSITINKIVTGG
jgi:hypothetical protein